MAWYQVIVAALLVEALLETYQYMLEEEAHRAKRGTALVIGIGIALGARIDIFEAAGVPLLWPYAGQVATGLIIARGSNVAHDLYEGIKQIKGDFEQAA